MKKILLLFLSFVVLIFFVSCGDNNDNESAGIMYYEHLEDLESGEMPNFLLLSNLKVDTEIQETKKVNIEFRKIALDFIVDDPNLTSLSTKEILEMYSDFDQQLTFSITRIIECSDKNYNYYSYSRKYKKISEEVIYSKEDTVRYLVSDDFAKDFPKTFSISVDDLLPKNYSVDDKPVVINKYFIISYVLKIIPKDEEGIKLIRPASSSEVNLYEKSKSEYWGIGIGDPISYVRYRPVLEKELESTNYYKLCVKYNRINVLPYDKNTVHT